MLKTGYFSPIFEKKFSSFCQIFQKVRLNGVRLKGGYIAQSKNLKFRFMILADRVGLDEFVGTGKTVKFGLICLPDTKEKSKNRFSHIAFSGHVTCFNLIVFVQRGAEKSGLQYAMVELGMSSRHRDEKVSSLAFL